MGRIFDCSRTFCWGLKESNSLLENTHSLLQAALSKFHREELGSQDKLSLQKQCGLGSDSRKAVNRRVPDISAYCSNSKFTVRPVQPWDVFLLFLKRNIFLFIGHVKQNPLCSIASNVFPKQIFIRFYSDIWRLSRYFDPLVRKNQYNRNFIDEKKLFHFNEILCFTQSSQLRNQEVAS